MHISNKISNYFHKFATKEFPSPIQSFINNSYIKLLGLKMEEFNDPSSYKTLNKLFTRALRIPRAVDANLDDFISPTDSFITEAGNIEFETALQIKGMSYSVKKVLTDHISNENYEKLIDGSFMNFYLSPKDYHRYHASFNAQVTKLIHVPGKLYPVNFTYLKKQNDLFIENERVILECIAPNGKLFYMIFVGALNVGKMVFTFEPRVKTNSDIITTQMYKYQNLHIKKGDCLGYFEMGSTVVMFWEKNFVQLENLVNQKVRFTQKIASVRK